MVKKYRYDVAVCLLAPAIFAVLIAAGRDGTPDIGQAEAGALLLVLTAGVLAEVFTLNEQGDTRSADSGRVSGFLTGLALALPLGDRLIVDRFQFGAAPAPALFTAGALLFLAGTALRWLAKAHLKEHFSHTIRLLPEHRVIKTGPYRLVRHPAYLGTLLLVLGNSVLFNSWVGVVLAAVLVPFGWRRILREEALLLSELGAHYSAYAARVKRLIPWVL